MSPEEKRRRLHDQVVARVKKGATRPEAMYAVAEDWGLRPGHVAAAYYQELRAIAREAAAAREPKQLTLDGVS